MEGHRRGNGDSIRATRARAGRGAFRPRPVQGISSRVTHDRRGTVAEDQRVEPREIGQPVGRRDGEMGAACPGGARRTEAMDQEQKECSGPPPPQSLGTIGPHCNLRLGQSQPRLSGADMPPRSGSAVTRGINIRGRGEDLQGLREERGRQARCDDSGQSWGMPVFGHSESPRNIRTRELRRDLAKRTRHLQPHRGTCILLSLHVLRELILPVACPPWSRRRRLGRTSPTNDEVLSLRETGVLAGRGRRVAPGLGFALRRPPRRPDVPTSSRPGPIRGESPR